MKQSASGFFSQAAAALAGLLICSIASSSWSQSARVLEQDGILASLDFADKYAVVAWRFSKYLPDSMKLTGVEATSNGEQLGDPIVEPYPQSGDLTSIVFLLDVTDPQRATQIDIDKVSMFQLIGHTKPHHQASIIVYADKPELLDTTNGSVGTLINMVAGARARLAPANLDHALQVTIETLGKEAVSRRAIFVLTDGHADDVLDVQQLVTKAKEKKVALVFLVSPGDRPVDLPILALLAQATGGQLIGMDGRTAFLKDPFGLIDSGVTARFPLKEGLRYFWQSNPEIKVVFQYGSRQLVLSAPAQIPAAGPVETARYLGSNHPYIAGGAGAAVLALVAGGIFLARRPQRKGAAVGAAEDDEPELRPVFAILQNIDDGTSHSISSDRVNLGRASTNDIVVDDKAVSREHAVIFRDESGQFVIESSGANGTFVNHLQIERAPLASGDLITIGDSTLRFVQTKA
jgi:hypothetical protein